jgi:NTP pyrophosphatase (non-canonical NTP hydrolase)
MSESKLQLKENPTLSDLQKYVEEMVIERGFEKETVPQIFMMLMEECGEMAKSARKSEGIQTDENSKKHNLGHEAADILIYLLDICNHYNINLETAFREKEELNKKRTWK